MRVCGGNTKLGGTFSIPSVFPAKAGIHSESALTTGIWIPACAGKTEVLHNRSLNSTLHDHRLDFAQGLEFLRSVRRLGAGRERSAMQAVKHADV